MFDANLEASLALGREGATSSAALQDLVKRLTPPRVVWLMVPAGEATAKAVDELGRLMAAGDTIIDGGNSFWKDDIARAGVLRAKSIHYLDVGTSGGVWGLERGYCLMIGGEKDVVERLDPIFRALAPGTDDIAPTLHREGRDPRPAQGYIHAGLGDDHQAALKPVQVRDLLQLRLRDRVDLLADAHDDMLQSALKLGRVAAQKIEGRWTVDGQV